MKRVVWIPMLDGDERAIAIDDEPLVHVAPQYWDGKQLLGAAIAGELGLEHAAWDIYLFYPATAEWTDQQLPEPTAALAQMGGVVVATPGTLPPFADQSRLLAALHGHAIVVGEQTDLEALLARAAAPFAN